MSKQSGFADVGCAEDADGPALGHPWERRGRRKGDGTGPGKAGEALPWETLRARSRPLFC